MRKKLPQYPLLIVLLLGLVTCKKNDKDAQVKDESTFKRSVVSAISQPTANELTYEPSTVDAEIDFLSIEYDPNLHVVNSSISLDNSPANFDYVLNFDDQLWKVNQEDQINQKVTNLSAYNLSISTIQSSLSELEAIMENIIATASDPVIYSLSINISILKTLERKFIDPNNCNCTVHPSFLVGKTYFMCQEDHFYIKADLIGALTQYESDFGSNSEATAMKQYAQAFSGDVIPFKNIYGLSISSQDFDQTIENIKTSGSGNCGWYCLLGCGSDHGCCSNYRGCCFYRDVLCYVHDKVCIDCKAYILVPHGSPTYTGLVKVNICGPACKPGEAIPDPVASCSIPLAFFNLDKALLNQHKSAIINFILIQEPWADSAYAELVIEQAFQEGRCKSESEAVFIVSQYFDSIS